jgi:hypothetical protein
MQGQLIAAQPQQLDVSLNGQFGFDMEVASSLTRDEMAQVSEALKLVHRNGSNGHGGNGSG